MDISISLLVLLISGVSGAESEPIVTTKQMTALLPGELCTESVEVCVPYWRELLGRLGSSGVTLHLEHPEDPEQEPFVFVSDVIPGSVGDRAGILVGDRVLSVNGVSMSPEPRSALFSPELTVFIGERKTFLIEREGKRLDFSIVTERGPKSSGDIWIYRLIAENFGYGAAERFRAQNRVVPPPHEPVKQSQP